MHRIELEMQNEELKLARAELEAGLEREKIMTVLESKGIRRRRPSDFEESPTAAHRTTMGTFKIRY